MPKPIVEAWECESCGEEYESEHAAWACEIRHTRVRRDDAWIVLMTWRKPEKNAVIQVLSDKDEPISDLTEARVFTLEEIARWMQKEARKHPEYQCTAAPLRGNGVPPLPWEGEKAGSGGARQSEGKNP
jgi:hypothetical protein